MENQIVEKKSKRKYPSRLAVVVHLWNGTEFMEGIPAEAPIRTLRVMAAKFKELEEVGILRKREDGKTPRTDKKFENDARWYLTKAAKDGLIDRPYRARGKAKVEVETSTMVSPAIPVAPIQTAAPIVGTVETIDTPLDDY